MNGIPTNSVRVYARAYSYSRVPDSAPMSRSIEGVRKNPTTAMSIESRKTNVTVWPATRLIPSRLPAPLFWATSTVPATLKPIPKLITRKMIAHENDSAETPA